MEASLAELAPRLGVLAPRLGVSRPESVPNLTRRFTEVLRSEVRVRRDLAQLEESLSEFRKDKNSKLGPTPGPSWPRGRLAPLFQDIHPPDLVARGGIA